MRLITRHVTAHYQLLRTLGLRGTGQMVTQMWPVWDSIMLAAVYDRSGASFVTTALANELGLESRIDPVPTPKDLLAQAPDLVDEPSLAKRSKVGSWEVVWLGEREVPLQISPLRDSEFDRIPTKTFDLLQLGLASGAAAFNSDTKWLVVDDEHGAIEVAYEVSELLGYAPTNHRWVPDEWSKQPVEPGFRVRYDTVTAADGLDVSLRSFTVRLNGCSVYLPRLWFGEKQDVGELSISLTV